MSEHAFDQDVVKVGKLQSSHLMLDDEGVSRMHAVLERSADVWRLIDLGSAGGSYLDGERVERNAVLPKEGTLSFGQFDVKYVIGATSLADVVDDEAKVRFEMAAHDHHHALMESLMAELERAAPRSHRSASFMQKGWHLFDDEKKRKYLRLMVQTIRETREESAAFERRSAAAMLALGPKGIEDIYDLEPEEALAKARHTLHEMTQAKASLELLREMDLLTSVTQASEAAKGLGQKGSQGLAQFKRGHADLVDNLETSLAAGSTIVLACISRAGGSSMSDEERAQLREHWNGAVNAAKRP